MIWNKTRILREIARRRRAGEELSYNAVARNAQSLVSAAAYHFGSYRKAIEAAGLDYAGVMRRPLWTRKSIIQLIKRARRAGIDLHWSAVTRRRDNAQSDDLRRAAFAAVQPRLFGAWDRALHAAGLDADEVNRYRRWSPEAVSWELRARARDREAVNSAAVQRDDSGLHAAALRHFGSFDKALRKARVDPKKVRQRNSWTAKQVIAAVRAEYRTGNHLSDSQIRQRSPALYGAAMRLFGSFTAAREEAGVVFKRKSAKPTKKRK